MSVDTADLRRTAGLFASGVTVIAVGGGGEVHAMTANSFTSVSLDPPLILFCVSRRAHLAELLEQECDFSVNILRLEQRALSRYFAAGWRDAPAPPFRFVAWDRCARLEGCAAAIACTLTTVVDAGDHWIVVGRVVALHTGVPPLTPLLFFDGRYEELAGRHGIPAPELASDPIPILAYYDSWEPRHSEARSGPRNNES